MLETATATMARAFASLGSQAFTALFLPAPLPVLEMANAFPLVLPCLVSVMKVSKAMTVRKSRAQMRALVMANVLRVCALARMVGEARTALAVVQVMANVVMETVNVLKVSAIAILAGPAMLATSGRAFMIAANTGIAKMEPVFVRRATGAVTAHCHQSPSLVSVPSIAFAAVCSSALRFTKLRVLDPPTSVTPNALKNAFLSVLQGKCP